MKFSFTVDCHHDILPHHRQAPESGPCHEVSEIMSQDSGDDDLGAGHTIRENTMSCTLRTREMGFLVFVVLEVNLASSD